MTAIECKLLKDPKHTWKITCLVGILLTLTCLAMVWQTFSQTVDKLSGSVVRLHILANSDSESDQRVKLLVRDAILSETSGWFSGEETGYEVEEILLEKLPEIENQALKTLRSQGLDYPVSCTLEKSSFNTRVYQGFTLPAGEYDALSVRIGSAEGKNWWCMVYPELCIPPAIASENGELETVNPDFDGVTDYIITHPERFKVRFKTAELLQELKDFCKELKEKLKSTDVPAEVE